jgi:hypothetical protein
MESAIRHYGELFARTPTATAGLNGSASLPVRGRDCAASVQPGSRENGC